MEPFMIPSFVLKVDSIPKLGSGKTDVMTAKELARELVEAGNK
jgi:acyl-[acyl-carrier-protein]-phospholipid O-acyltransferase/long-chain-fatty-acid--[acyl-carrier-protein] ligase